MENGMSDKHWWEEYPWRQVQTNLREIDMLDIDAAEYVRQLQQFHATVVMINTGGILASYATHLPFHFQSPYLTGDSLKTIIDACHTAGIRVVARTDFSKIRRPIYEAHPEWAYRTIDGEMIDYEGNVHACICGGFQQEYAFQILGEILTTLPVDGLFINMGGFQTRDYSHRSYSLCHCDNCKKRFQARFGMPLPRKADARDTAYQAYRVFQQEVVSDYNQRLEAFVHGINPEVAINGVDFFRMESNTEYKRPLPHWQYSASSNTRCLRGISEPRVVSNTTVDFIGFFYRHIGVGAAQQKLRLYQQLANLGSLDYYLIGRLDNHLDRTPYEGIREVFRFHQKHEADYHHLHSRAEALLLRANVWGDAPEERGWVRALTENHILFDEAVEKDVLAGSLERYKAIILPDSEQISAALCAKLDAYAAQGGIVVSSGRSGRSDEFFAARETPPLACLGIERVQFTREDMVSAMFLIGPEEKQVFKSFADVDAFAFGDALTYQEYSPAARTYFRLLPPQPFGPPERCYGGAPASTPGIAVHPYGKGQGISIPFLIGSLYYKEGYENSFLLLKDVLTCLCGIQPAAPDLTPMVEITLGVNEAGGHALLQLVNTSGHFGTSYFKPVPVDGVVVDIPLAEKVLSAQSLVDGRSIPFEQVNSRVRLEVNRVNEFESVKLGLAKA
jgi:hypothetical protein